MSAVPYTFADNTGNIPLSQLDANFANCKAFADTAGVVTINAQPTITSVGTLTSLSVTGNITGGNLITGGNISGTLTTATQANITSLGTLSNVSVAGNVVSGNLITVNSTLSGNLVVQGNAFLQSNTLVVANGATTNAQINGAGINAGNPTLAYIRYSDSGNAWTTTSNFFAGNVISANVVAANSMNLAGTLDNTGNIIGNNINSTSSFRLSVYANTTVRDSTITSPVPGMMIFVTGTGMQVRGSTQWNTVAGSGT